MTLTFRDRFIIIILAFVIGIYAGYQVLWIPNTKKIAGLEESKQSIQRLSGDLKPLLKEKERLKKVEKEVKDSVNNIKSLSGCLTATNEEFLVFLGDSAKENNVIVSGFNDLGTEVNDGIFRSVFDFELKGNSTDINKVLEDINNIGIKCSYGSISYRQNEGYDYLRRYFDEVSELPWYKEKEEEKEEKEPEEKEEENIDEQKEPQKTPKTENQVSESVVEQIPQQQIPLEQYVPEKQEEPKEQEEKPETIEDRLNELLSLTSFYSADNYSAMFLNSLPDIEYKAGQQMKLNVTLCLIMYNEPSFENSFLMNAESGTDAVL